MLSLLLLGGCSSPAQTTSERELTPGSIRQPLDAPTATLATTSIALPVLEGVAPVPSEAITSASVSEMQLLAVFENDSGDAIYWSPDSGFFYLGDTNGGYQALLDQVNFSGAEPIPCRREQWGATLASPPWSAVWAAYSPDLSLTVWSEGVPTHDATFIHVFRMADCGPGPMFDFTLHGGLANPHIRSSLPRLFAAISPDNRLLAAGGLGCGWPDNHFLRVFDLLSGETRYLLGMDETNQVAFSRDGRLLGATRNLWCKPDAVSAEIWDMSDGSRLHTLEGAVYPLVFSPDGRWLATGVTSGGYERSARSIVLWDIAEGLQVLQIDVGERVEFLDFSPDGSLLATSSPLTEEGPGGIRLWDMATGNLVFRADIPNPDELAGYPAGPVAFSPDGRYLAGGFRHGGYPSIGLWGVWRDR